MNTEKMISLLTEIKAKIAEVVAAKKELSVMQNLGSMYPCFGGSWVSFATAKIVDNKVYYSATASQLIAFIDDKLQMVGVVVDTPAPVPAPAPAPAPAAPAKSYTIATKAGYSGAKWHVREMTEAEVIAEAENSSMRRGKTLMCHADIEMVGVGDVDEYGDYLDFAPSRDWYAGEQMHCAIKELNKSNHEFRLFANAIDQDKISAFKAYYGIE